MNEKEKLHRRHHQLMEEMIYSSIDLLITKINFSFINLSDDLSDHTAAILYFTPHLKDLRLNNASISSQEM